VAPLRLVVTGAELGIGAQAVAKSAGRGVEIGACDDDADVEARSNRFLTDEWDRLGDRGAASGAEPLDPPAARAVT
jgi:hypothetical protein